MHNQQSLMFLKSQFIGKSIDHCLLEIPHFYSHLPIKLSFYAVRFDLLSTPICLFWDFGNQNTIWNCCLMIEESFFSGSNTNHKEYSQVLNDGRFALGCCVTHCKDRLMPSGQQYIKNCITIFFFYPLFIISWRSDKFDICLNS